MFFPKRGEVDRCWEITARVSLNPAAPAALAAHFCTHACAWHLAIVNWTPAPVRRPPGGCWREARAHSQGTPCADTAFRNALTRPGSRPHECGETRQRRAPLDFLTRIAVQRVPAAAPRRIGGVSGKPLPLAAINLPACPILRFLLPLQFLGFAQSPALARCFQGDLSRPAKGQPRGLRDSSGSCQAAHPRRLVVCRGCAEVLVPLVLMIRCSAARSQNYQDACEVDRIRNVLVNAIGETSPPPTTSSGLSASQRTRCCPRTPSATPRDEALTSQRDQANALRASQRCCFVLFPLSWPANHGGNCAHAGCLQDTRLLLKPDVYSILGIYAKNDWGLKPTVLKQEFPQAPPSG